MELITASTAVTEIGIFVAAIVALVTMTMLFLLAQLELKLSNTL
jgi:hypothetical protein